MCKQMVYGLRTATGKIVTFVSNQTKILIMRHSDEAKITNFFNYVDFVVKHFSLTKETEGCQQQKSFMIQRAIEDESIFRCFAVSNNLACSVPLPCNLTPLVVTGRREFFSASRKTECRLLQINCFVNSIYHSWADPDLLATAWSVGAGTRARKTTMADE
jgi:hypothetical protein